MNEPLIEFKPKLSKLSKNESQVLKLLIEAVKLIAPIYLEQEHQFKNGLKKEEIEKAAKKDSSIASPFTVIEKVDGKLRAIPYHIKYEEFLKPVSAKLKEASVITDNRDFGKALKIQANSLLDGNYNEATVSWLKTKPYILDISIGPVDHFDDQLFFSKASYQAWAGVLDIGRTEKMNEYKNVIHNARRKTLMSVPRVEVPDKVKLKVTDVILFSGHMARTKFVGVNLPMDVSFVEKYGSEITLFNQPNDLRLEEQIIPTFNKTFSKAFRLGFSEEDLRRGNLRYIAIHELAHSYLYYRNAAKNLKDLFICIYELAATVLGLRMAGPLLLKDIVTSKQLESMIITFICRSLFLARRKQEEISMINRTLGSVIFINFLLESDALKFKDGLAVPNFMKIFIALQELSSLLERLLSSGTRKEAEIFIQKFGHLKYLS